MDLYYETQKILEEAGYRTSRSSEKDWLAFEDESLFGFVSVVTKVEEIVETWQMAQDFFLAHNALSIRNFPSKAWNAYSIFITDAVCLPSFKARLVEIEEDFRGTRKIIQTDIASSDELYAALFPLLPIKNCVTLKDVDAGPRLDSRLSFLKASELEVLRKGESAASFADIILEEE